MQLKDNLRFLSFHPHLEDNWLEAIGLLYGYRRKIPLMHGYDDEVIASRSACVMHKSQCLQWPQATDSNFADNVCDDFSASEVSNYIAVPILNQFSKLEFLEGTLVSKLEVLEGMYSSHTIS